jgi:membrane dipeptidase
MDSKLQDALSMLDTLPLVDGHNDLPYVIRADKTAQGDVAAFDLGRRHERRDTDIPRLKEGRVSAQIWAAYVPPGETRPTSFALEQIALVRRMNALFPDVFLPASRAADIKRAKRRGLIASFIAIENGAAIDNRPETLAAFYDLGVRLMTLCHNHTTDWCDSATDAPRHGGLNELGKRVIAEMNRLGMLIDLAHVSDTVMHQVLDLSRAPVVWSHSNARHLCDHPRNVPDDVLARVRNNGGIVMANFVPDFISQRSRDWTRPFKDNFGKTRSDISIDHAVPAQERENGPWPRGTLNEFCDHVDYLAQTIGHQHVGLGSDFFGGPQGSGLEDASCFPKVLAELMQRGWSTSNIRRLASGNFIRVLEAVEKQAEQGVPARSNRAGHG